MKTTSRNTRNKLTSTMAKSALIVLLFAIVFASVLSVSLFADSATDLDNNASVENIASALDSSTISQIGTTITVYNEGIDGTLWMLDNYNDETEWFNLKFSDTIVRLINRGVIKLSGTVWCDTNVVWGSRPKIYVKYRYNNGTETQLTTTSGGNIQWTSSTWSNVSADFAFTNLTSSVISFRAISSANSLECKCGITRMDITLSYNNSSSVALFDKSGTTSLLNDRTDFDVLSLAVANNWSSSIVNASGINYQVANSITDFGSGFTPIGTSTHPFVANLNGNNATIGNLTNM